MFITALCPTFRHPDLLANSLWLWEQQDYPARLRRLVILDDGQTFDNQHGPTWTLHSAALRFPSLPAKYNRLLVLSPARTEAFLVWEDDDIYLPGYVSAFARALVDHELAKPAVVYSDYSGRLEAEAAEGRFHSCLGFRRELINRIGGWPETKRADFDQQLIGSLFRNARSCGDPWPMPGDCQYIMGWHTGAAHGQNTMRGPDDETWYDRNVESYAPVPRVGQLVPRCDERANKILLSMEKV